MKAFTDLSVHKPGSRINDGVFKKTVAAVLSGEVSMADALAISRKFADGAQDCAGQ